MQYVQVVRSLDASGVMHLWIGRVTREKV